MVKIILKLKKSQRIKYFLLVSKLNSLIPFEIEKLFVNGKSSRRKWRRTGSFGSISINYNFNWLRKKESAEEKSESQPQIELFFICETVHTKYYVVDPQSTSRCTSVTCVLHTILLWLHSRGYLFAHEGKTVTHFRVAFVNSGTEHVYNQFQFFDDTFFYSDLSRSQYQGQSDVILFQVKGMFSSKKHCPWWQQIAINLFSWRLILNMLRVLTSTSIWSICIRLYPRVNHLTPGSDIVGLFKLSP